MAAVEHLVDGPRGDAAALREDRDAVAGVLDLDEEVAGHEHGPSLVAERPEELADLLDPGRVEAVGGLVEDQQLGVLEERLGQAEPLAHPERVGLHEVVGSLRQPDPLERPGRRPAVRCRPPDRAARRLRRPVIVGNSAGVSTMAPIAADHPPDLAPGSGRRAAGRSRRSVGSARAGSGSWSSSPSRSARGTRRPRRRAPRGRARRPPPASGPARGGTPCAGPRSRSPVSWPQHAAARPEIVTARA